MANELFQREEFSKLKFNVYDVKAEVDLLKEFPLLGRIESFKSYNGADSNRLIRYIIYMYDLESPLIKRFPKLDERQIECATLSGFNLVKDKSRLVNPWLSN